MHSCIGQGVLSRGPDLDLDLDLGAGLPTIPAIVKPPPDRVAGYVTFVDENVHRVGLSALDETRAYSPLADAGLSQRGIAEQLRISQGQFSKRLAMLKLPRQVQYAIAADHLAVAEALSLSGVPAEDQDAAWDEAQRTRVPLSTVVTRIEATEAGQPQGQGTPARKRSPSRPVEPSGEAASCCFRLLTF